MSLPASDDLVFAAIFLIVFPVVDYLLVKKLKLLAHKWFYAWTLATEWLLTIAVAELLLRHGLTLSAIGEQWGRRVIALACVGAGAILVAIMAASTRKKLAQLSPERLSKVLRAYGPLAPRSRVERALFVVVSLTAGFCEEILYRGWLWQFFRHLTGNLWIAVLLSAVAFGFAHAYQGRSQIITTGIMGLVFSVPVLLSNSLIPSQVLHAAIDIVNGMILGNAANSLAGRAPNRVVIENSLPDKVRA